MYETFVEVIGKARRTLEWLMTPSPNLNFYIPLLLHDQMVQAWFLELLRVVSPPEQTHDAASACSVNGSPFPRMPRWTQATRCLGQLFALHVRLLDANLLY